MKRLVAILAVALAVALGYSVYLASIRKSDFDRVRIAQNGDFFSYAPLYIAIDAGFFKRQQIDAILVNVGGDEKSWAAVLSGDVDFGVGDPAFVAISTARGQSGRVIGTLINGVPFWGLTYRTDIRPFSEPRDINGYMVATFPSPSTAYALQKRMFESAGLPAKIREGAFGSLLPMLKSGQADIALELEPNVTQARNDGALVLYSLSKIYGSFAITGIQVTELTLQNRSGLVRRALCAWQAGLDLIHMNRAEAVRLLAVRFPEIKREVAEPALARMIDDGTIPKTLEIDDDAWSKVVKLRVELGDLSSAGPMHMYVNNDIARSVVADRNCRL